MWKKVSIALFVLLILSSVAYLFQIYGRHKAEEVNELYYRLINNIAVNPNETLSTDIVKEIIRNKDNPDITKVYLSEFVQKFNELHYKKNIKEEDVDLIIESDYIIYRIRYDEDIDYAYQYYTDGKIYKVATFLLYGRYYSVNYNDYRITKYSAQDPIFFKR